MKSAINFAMKKAGVVELEEKHPLSASIESYLPGRIPNSCI